MWQTVVLLCVTDETWTFFTRKRMKMKMKDADTAANESESSSMQSRRFSSFELRLLSVNRQVMDSISRFWPC